MIEAICRMVEGIFGVPHPSPKTPFKTLSRVLRKRLICNNGETPKWNLILYLSILGKLSTRDRLGRWGITTEESCPLCTEEEESINHCTYVATVQGKLLKWMGISRQLMSKVALPVSRYIETLAGCVYFIRRERNMRIFQAKQRQAEQIVKLIIQEVHFIKTHS